MESSQIISIVVMVFLVVASGFFSASETAFSSMNRARVRAQAQEGNKRAQLALAMSDDYDKLISTILIGNNIVNIALATLATIFFVAFWPSSGASISTIVTTVIVLIFGEITPKSLAKDAPESIAMAFAPLLRMIEKVLSPINFVFSVWKKWICSLLKLKADRRVTDEELLNIVEEAQEEGGIDEEEGELIQNVISFYEREASQILTPRVDVVGVSADATKEEIDETFRQYAYSRMPVYRETMDDVAGIIHIKDFYAQVVSGGKKLEEIIKPAVFVSPTQQISVLMSTLQSNKAHMAIVTDEYGGTTGIVTMEDILEELVGEIWDEHDDVVCEVEQLEENLYRVSAGMEAEAFLEHFELEDEPDSSTVGGWAMEKMGRVPRDGEAFEFGEWSFVVHMVDRTRIDELIATRIHKPDSREEENA